MERNLSDHASRSDGAREFRGTSRFTLGRTLGRGGSGIVYEAVDETSGAVVALKTLLDHDASALYQFKQEFRALADLVHPNLVKLFELHQHEDTWFYTMEIVHGVPFDQAVRSSSSAAAGRAMACNVARLRSLALQLALGVDAIHGAGKIHRDLKPSNVMVSSDGRVIVLDLGLVAEIASNDPVDSSGTPSFMAPEAVTGDRLTAAADWYSVGVILYEAITGAKLFAGGTPAILLQKTSAQPARPSAVVDDVPRDLDELVFRLLATDPRARPAPREIMATLSPDRVVAVADETTRASLAASAATPFVGRDGELATLRQALAASRTSRGACIALVEGLSGVGKSTLLRRFVEDVQRSQPDTIVLHASCFEQESVPFKAVDGAVDALTRVLQRLSPDELRDVLPHLSWLARLFPVLTSVDAIARVTGRVAGSDDSALDDATEPHETEIRRRAFAAMRRVLSRLAMARPLLLMIDDLQWSDLDSTVLLEEIVRAPNGPSILFVAGFRSDEQESSEPLARLLSTIRAQQQREGAVVVELALRPLTHEEARDVARALLRHSGGEALRDPGGGDDTAHGDDAWIEARADALARESGGVPLFVTELARAAAVGGGNDERDLGPPDLSRAIMGRVSRMSPEAQQLLRVLAVASGPVPRAVASIAAGTFGQDEVAFNELRGARLLRSRSVGEHAASWLELYHDRIRQALVAALAQDEVRALHLTLADVLAAQGADAEVLAFHLERAGKCDEAIEHIIDAADRANSTLAFHHAAQLFARAAALTDDSSEEKTRLLERQARAFQNAGRPNDAACGYLLAGARLPARESRDLRRLAAEQLLRCGRDAEGKALLEDLLRDARMPPPRTTRLTMPSVLFQDLRLRVRGARFEEKPAAALDQDVLFRADLARTVAVGFETGAEAFASVEFQIRYLHAALDAGEPKRIAHALARDLVRHAVIDGPKSVKSEPDRLRTLAALVTRLGDPYLEAYFSFCVALSRTYQLRFAEGVPGIDDGITLLRNSGVGVWSDVLSGTLGQFFCLLSLDRWAELARRATSFLVEAESHGDAFATACAEVHQVIDFAIRGDAARARATLARVRDGVEKGFSLMQFQLWWHGTIVDLHEGDVDAAWRRLHETWLPMKRALFLWAPISRTFAHSLRAALGIAAAQRGIAGARAVAVESVKELARIPFAWSSARAPLYSAGLAALDGDTSRAVVELRRAITDLDRASLPLHAAAARSRLAALVDDAERAPLLAAAAAVFRAEEVAYPARLIAALAPGF